MSLFRTENIIKSYANHLALNDVSINVPEGSIYGLLGPNGAGKTTLIRIINQIIAPDSGEIFFNDTKLNSSHVFHIGYLPEERGLYKKMKVGEQAIYLAQLKGLSKKEAIRTLKHWFEKFEIMPWWDKKVEDLSKGMAQKIQFIVTILHNPRLLIFDEPFSGFDPINANLMKNEILKLREDGATIIFSTHNMGSVEELCDHISLINESKCILSGPINEVREKFRSKTFEIRFTGHFNKFEATLSSLYKILEHSQEDNTTILKISLQEDISTNELLAILMKSGNVTSFNEIIPSMNDIFIKAVKENSATLRENNQVANNG